MPRKIENLIKEGLPSKIYLQAYAAPISRYQIARNIYDIQKGIPPTSKISTNARDLINKGYIKQVSEDRIISRVEPLISEIEK